MKIEVRINKFKPDDNQQGFTREEDRVSVRWESEDEDMVLIECDGQFIYVLADEIMEALARCSGNTFNKVVTKESL